MFKKSREPASHRDDLQASPSAASESAASAGDDQLPSFLMRQTETAPMPDTNAQPASQGRASTSLIGRFTDVQGDIFSEENLTIEGSVEGTVTCKANIVTLGSEGSLNGNAYAHTLHVSGQVEGNLVGLEKVTIHQGARVSGTIITPSLVIEDGSHFYGNIDMDPGNEIFERIFHPKTADSLQSKQSTPLEQGKTASPSASDATSGKGTPKADHTTPLTDLSSTDLTSKEQD